jgi:hypothetical protein
VPTSETREQAWYRRTSEKRRASRRASGSLSRS